VIEARVDIAGRKMESWKEVKGVQAPVIESEFRELGELVKKDPRVIEALAKRGIKDLTTVECVPCRMAISPYPNWRVTASCTAAVRTCTAPTSAGTIHRRTQHTGGRSREESAQGD